MPIRSKIVLLAGVSVGCLLAAPAFAQTTQSSGKDRTAVVQEVVVTAQKRTQRLQDVPMSVTALNGQQLTNTQSFRFEDFVAKVPGLTMIESGSTGSQLVLRGITTGSVAINSSVATYVDETPYTAVGQWAGSYLVAPNLDTYDMKRIEVLRGPQGTLYGANALGGILKYVTNAPDPSRFASSVEVGASSVSHGGVGYDVHAMVNAPLSNNAALRIVAYDNHYPGYIDDPARKLKDINGSTFSGVRASLLYEPTAQFSVRLNAVYQRRQWDDYGNEDVKSGSLAPVYGDLRQVTLISQSGQSTNQIYNITVNWDVGFANLLSTTSYSKFSTISNADGSNKLGALVNYYLGNPYTGIVDVYQPHLDSVTQEVRVSSKGGGALGWQVGAYYTDETGGDIEHYWPINGTTRGIDYGNSALGDFEGPVTYKEIAGFADLTYKITPQFEVGLGGRYSSNRQTFTQETQNPYGIFSPYPAPLSIPSSERVFTYSADARWRFTSQGMVYFRTAEGFAPGGPNDVPRTAPNAQPTYTSSTDTSYELGIKGSLFNGRLTADVSAFHIDWSKIQLTAVIDGFNQFVNGGGARSDGVEWSLGYIPLDGLTFGFSGAYTDAHLTSATPATVGGRSGDRLPGVPLWQSTVSADYEHEITENFRGFAGLDWQFTGGRYADFLVPGPRQTLPSYDLVNLRAGVRSGRWTITVYCKNVGDVRAFNYLAPESRSQPGLGNQSAVVLTPRTVGATLAATF